MVILLAITFDIPPATTLGFSSTTFSPIFTAYYSEFLRNPSFFLFPWKLLRQFILHYFQQLFRPFSGVSFENYFVFSLRNALVMPLLAFSSVILSCQIICLCIFFVSLLEFPLAFFSENGLSNFFFIFPSDSFDYFFGNFHWLSYNSIIR